MNSAMDQDRNLNHKRPEHKKTKWTMQNFPFPEENLNTKVKEKAVDIANQLYREGVPEGKKLIEQAISKTKEWFLEMEG